MAGENTEDTQLLPVIFTDLDGTLLDHHTYDYSPAKPALRWIKEHDIPLILCSSKTQAEISELQRDLGVSYPAIVENGGGVSVPDNYFEGQDISHTPGMRFADIEAVLNDSPEALRHSFQGFCDWSVEEVAQKTGLSLEAARKAKARDWSIPGLWSGDEADFSEFTNFLGKSGVQVTRGGRFAHLMGDCSKGMTMTWLLELFSRKFPSKSIVSIALGDAPNDVSMLSVADYAIVIPNFNGTVMDLDTSKVDGKLHYASKPGPAGWNDSILPILKAF